MISPDDLSVKLIAALSAIWAAIRRRHPRVPPVVLLPAPAPKGEDGVLGHFAALRWRPVKNETASFHEVVVVAEHLNRGIDDILDTLLHEAAHALNFERGVFDCSRSQYHNRRFKLAAEELGLMVKQVAHYGFAETSLALGTAERYAEETRVLDNVLIHRQRLGGASTPPPGTTPTTGGPPDGDTGTNSRSRKAVCPCGYIIRVSKKTIEETVIRCERCGEPFRLA